MPVGEKKVGLPELFYDLVFAYALSRTTELVHHADEADYVTFLISLVILFTVWLYQSIYINRFGDNSWQDRLFLFADMFLLLFCPMRWAATGWQILCRLILRWGYWSAVSACNICCSLPATLPPNNAAESSWWRDCAD